MAQDGTIYVTDYAAQTVRAIDKSNTVRTIAGGGDLIENGLKVRGGFADGPGAVARFNGPAGIAIDKMGRIFVADSANRCIRVIEAGSVRTYAGAPSRSGGDGPVQTAGFWEPRALAFDGEGTLWVGDGVNGLRAISKSGIVSTVPVPLTRTEPVPTTFSSHITSIAFLGSQLYLSDGVSLLTFDPGHKDTLFYTEPDNVMFEPLPHEVMAWPGRAPAGYPFGLAALPNGVLVYTDPVLHAIRYRDITTSTALSRIPFEGDEFFGGDFADGQAGLVDSPLGIVAVSDHDAVFADAGNRRIRLVNDIDTRHAGSSADPFGAASDAKRYYRILFIGNSYLMYKMPFVQTAGGILEAELNAKRTELGLNKPVKVGLLWIGTVTGVRDYIREFVTENGADAVVWEFNAVFANDTVSDSSPLVSPVISAPKWRPPVMSAISEIRAGLRAAKIPFFVVGQPLPFDFAPIEETAVRLSFVGTPNEANYLGSESLFAHLFAAEANRYVDLWPAFTAAELKPDRHPLFSPADYHLSSYGQRLVGEAIRARLEEEAPWR